MSNMTVFFIFFTVFFVAIFVVRAVKDPVSFPEMVLTSSFGALVLSVISISLVIRNFKTDANATPSTAQNVGSSKETTSLSASATSADASAAAAPSPSISGDDESTMAYMHCKVHMSDRLKSPTSADFPWQPSTIGHQGNLYSLHSYVDAQNGFASKIRQQFTCSIRFNGGQSADITKWSLVDLSVSE